MNRLLPPSTTPPGDPLSSLPPSFDLMTYQWMVAIFDFVPFSATSNWSTRRATVALRVGAFFFPTPRTSSDPLDCFYKCSHPFPKTDLLIDYWDSIFPPHFPIRCDADCDTILLGFFFLTLDDPIFTLFLCLVRPLSIRTGPDFDPTSESIMPSHKKRPPSTLPLAYPPSLFLPSITPSFPPTHSLLLSLRPLPSPSPPSFYLLL